MMDFLRKHTRIIFLITILGFFAGVFIGFGSYFFGGKPDNVAEVNGKSISYRAYNQLMNRVNDSLRRENKEVTAEQMAQARQEVLQSLVQEEVFYQESRKYGIIVSDRELANDIQRYPQFQQNGAFDRMLYFRTLSEVLRMTPKEFEESRRRQIAIYKLRDLVASSVVVSNAEAVMAAQGSQRPEDIEKARAQLRQEEAMMTMNEWLKAINRTLKVTINLPDMAQAQPQ